MVSFYLKFDLIFDITDYPYFSYISPESYVRNDRFSAYEYSGSNTYYSGSMLDNRKYQFSKDGSLYLGSAYGQVYKLNDNDSSVEVISSLPSLFSEISYGQNWMWRCQSPLGFFPQPPSAMASTMFFPSPCPILFSGWTRNFTT